MNMISLNDQKLLARLRRLFSEARAAEKFLIAHLTEVYELTESRFIDNDGNIVDNTYAPVETAAQKAADPVTD